MLIGPYVLFASTVLFLLIQYVQDHVFDDSDDPAGGQYSSLADLVNVMKTFFPSTKERGVIPQHVVREWLRPLHTWQSWVGTFESSGAPWEILKAGEGRLYTKGYFSKPCLAAFSVAKKCCRGGPSRLPHRVCHPSRTVIWSYCLVDGYLY